MHYSPLTEKCPLEFSPFKSCTVPRPIGWISSLSKTGVANLAPYSQWQNLTFDPPMVMFSANQNIQGERKDTVRNIEETGWFVWNMATWDLREAVNKSAMYSPFEHDEFDSAGVTKMASVDCDVPRVAESPCHFECEYITTHRLPANSTVATIDVIFARVARIHIKDEVLTPDGKIDIPKIRPIGRMGYHDYAVINETFEMKIPAATEAEARGLEGRA